MHTFFLVDTHLLYIYRGHTFVIHIYTCVVEHICYSYTYINVVDAYMFSFTVIAYGVAMTSRLLKIIGLFCKRALYKRPYSAKETYHLRSLLMVATPYTYRVHICFHV